MKEFKLIIAGGRDFTDSKKMHAAIDQLVNRRELKDYAVSIVTGMARGTKQMIEYMKSLGKPTYIVRY